MKTNTQDNSFPISGVQKNEIHRLLDEPVKVPDLLRGGEANPHLRIFVVNFDGTGNNKDNVPSRELPTLVAASHTHFEQINQPHIQSRYYYGVGAAGNFLRKMYEGITGYGCKQNAQRAHRDLLEQIAIWKAEDPKCEVHVHVTGFSRGAATALHFLNVVNDLGGAKTSKHVNGLANDLMPGAIKTSALLYDTVSTGQDADLTLTVPYSCISALHIVAGGEERRAFPVRRIADSPEEEISIAYNCHMQGGVKLSDGGYRYQRINEVIIPGARHSDVGGAYVGGNLRDVSAYMAHHWQGSLGLPIMAHRPSFESVQNARAHDSRFAIEKFFSFKNDIEDRQNANVRLAEAVQNDVWDGRVIEEQIVEGISSTPLVKKTIETLSEEAMDAIAYVDEGFGFEKVRNMKVDDESKLVRESEVLTRHYNKSVAKLKAEQDPLVQDQDGPGDGAAPPSFVGPKIPIRLIKRQARLGVICEVNQVKGVPPPQPVSTSRESWPEGIRKILMHLNVTNEISSQAASKMMAKATAVATQELFAITKGIDRVQIRLESFVEQFTSGKLQRERFGITCNMGDGTSICNATIPSDTVESELYGRMQVLNRALMAVGNRLSELGYKPSAKFGVSVQRGEDVPSRQTRMTSVADPDAQLVAQAQHAAALRASLMTGPLWGSLLSPSTSHAHQDHHSHKSRSFNP